MYAIIYSSYICKTFLDLTCNEQYPFGKKYENWFSIWTLEFTYKFSVDSLIKNAYNGILLSKGLLLNSEMEMNKLLHESGDK